MKFAHLFISFFIDNFPSLKLICWLFPISLLWSFLTLQISGWCKEKLNWKTGYTRKLYHFLIFFTAFLYQITLGLPGVFILGWSVTITVLYACFNGNENILYEALAREKDTPFRTKYILYSYLATFIGGVFSNLFFGYFAIFGYVVTGVADAIAEPVGTRFGQHFYKVFSFDNKKSYRSMEGSLSVFISSLIFTSLIIYFSGVFVIPFSLLLLFALICTLVEAISPSGFDNALLQLTASFLFYAYYTLQH